MAGGIRHRGGFTIIELMVVIAVLGLLLAILLPALGAAHEAAQVVAVKADLYSIASAMTRYGLAHDNDWPPMRTYCEQWSAANAGHLPRELADGGYLTRGDDDKFLACGLYDRFNPGHTYKYARPGAGLHNDAPVNKYLFVPHNFPHDSRDVEPVGDYYNNLTRPKDSAGKVVPCPVDWVAYSVGPRFDANAAADPYAPVSRGSWYNGFGTRGVIIVLRRADGSICYSH